MNHINLLNNAISQTNTGSAQPTQANAADLNATRCDAVSTVALARIADANTPSSAPPEMTLERFVEELDLWCEEKSGSQEYSNRIRAKEIMIECFTTSSATLVLTFMNLTSLPEAIGALTNLKNINLVCNLLTSLPESIGLLRDLRILSLPFNHLTTLPAQIGSLTSLRELYLYDNQITSFPDSIGLLTDLQILSATSNQLRSLPEAICLLKDLKTLDLTNNRLTSLPARIGSMRGLKTFGLAYNQLRSLPDTIRSLTSLRELYLYNNQLTAVPESIVSLTALKLLNLSNNALTSLPSSILSLPHDCIVNLSNTALSVSVLTHLREETERALYHGPQFSYSMPALRVSQEQPLATMISDLYRIIGQPDKAFPNLEASDQGQHLRSWLNRLSYTATYQRGGDVQGQFVSQMIRYLETAEENESFCRNILMPILSDASETCGDRVALSILHIGVGHRLHHFDLSDLKGLSQFLIRGPMTLSILEQYARELIPTFRFVDEIEIYLGLPIMLKDRLNIPIDVNEMLFFQCSNLTEAHFEAAAARVHAQIDDLETRIQFLIEQTKWLEALERRFPSEMKAYREEYEQKLESRAEPLPAKLEYESHLKLLTKHILK